RARALHAFPTRRSSDLAFDGRRAERAVELAGGSFAAKPGERLARFAAAAIELLHPRLAESEWRGKVKRATVAGGGRGDLRSAQAEQPSHRSGDILGTLSTTDGTESIGNCVAIERSAVSLAQPAADLARGDAASIADQRPRQIVEDASSALDEDLVTDHRRHAPVDR